MSLTPVTVSVSTKLVNSTAGAGTDVWKQSSVQKDFSIQIGKYQFRGIPNIIIIKWLANWMHFKLRITLTLWTNKWWELFLYSELITMKAQDKSPARLRIIKIICFQI